MKNIPVLYKLMLLVVIMAAVTAGISGVAIVNTAALSSDTDEIDLAGREALLGARLNQDVINLNRGEYRIAADPSAATVGDVLSRTEVEQKRLDENLAELKRTADEKQAQMLNAIDDSYKAYLEQLQDTVVMAQEHGSKVEDSEARKVIRESVASSRAAAQKLEEAVRAFGTYSDNKSGRISQAASENADTIQKVMLALAVVGTVGGVGIGSLVGNLGISKPIGAAVGSLRKLSEGQTDIDIYGVGRKDEVGLIADTMQVFKENIIRNRKMEEEAKEAEIRAAEDRKVALNTMADNFQTSVGGIVQSVSSAATEMQSSSQTLSSTAEETSRQATAVAAAAEQASANVQTVASAADELSSSITEITRQVTKSTEITGRAVHEADRTHSQVQGLADAAQKIGEVVSLITDIAEQTNLLALNATIEAARAGEAGKGFAVVASEVKNLANQTAKATDEISKQVSGIQHETVQAVNAIDSIGKTITEVNEIATVIASAVEQQGAATQEIAHNVEQASSGTTEVTNNINGVSQAASETGNAATQMLDAAGELASNSETLKGQVENFLVTVRQS
tara:strand:- start:5823 stop:7523 length:1701 start_codon:yes stop_codon:yes gene_type:complete